VAGEASAVRAASLWRAARDACAFWLAVRADATARVVRTSTRSRIAAHAAAINPKINTMNAP